MGDVKKYLQFTRPVSGSYYSLRDNDYAPSSTSGRENRYNGPGTGSIVRIHPTHHDVGQEVDDRRSRVKLRSRHEVRGTGAQSDGVGDKTNAVA